MVSGLGIGVWDCGFWVLGFGFVFWGPVFGGFVLVVSGLGFWFWDFWFLVFGFGFWFLILGFGAWCLVFVVVSCLGCGFRGSVQGLGRMNHCSGFRVQEIGSVSSVHCKQILGALPPTVFDTANTRITQLKAQGPSRTCNESKEEEEDTREIEEVAGRYLHAFLDGSGSERLPRERERGE